MDYALKNGIKHILFYISSREARNLTDNEKNEELVKDDKIIIHHISEKKVYWKETHDSDWLLKDINTSVNKNQSRENSTKMKAAYKTKAENGWWPYRHTPLGYYHVKDKNEYGVPIKGTAKLTPGPNKEDINQVIREFELRVEGYSYVKIREIILAECLVPIKRIKNYSKRGIEGRLKNPLYWGYFYLYENPKQYSGKHEIIIPPHILKEVKNINESRNYFRLTRPIYRFINSSIV